MTYDCKRARYEQSDMVMILLNLGYIPDQVVRKIDFVPGWQVKFLENMNQYKKEFEQKYGKKWTFQNADLERDYVEFMRNQEKSDTALQTGIIKDNIWAKMGDNFRKISTKNKKTHALN